MVLCVRANIAEHECIVAFEVVRLVILLLGDGTLEGETQRLLTLALED